LKTTAGNYLGAGRGIQSREEVAPGSERDVQAKVKAFAVVPE